MCCERYRSLRRAADSQLAELARDGVRVARWSRAKVATRRRAPRPSWRDRRDAP